MTRGWVGSMNSVSFCCQRRKTGTTLFDVCFEFARGENVWLGKTEVRDEMR